MNTYQAFIYFLDKVKTNGFQLVPVRYRPYDEETAMSGGDYDFLLPSIELDSFLRLLFQCMSDAGIHFSIDRTKPEKCVIHLHVLDCGKVITLEVWSFLEVKDPLKRYENRISWQVIAPHLRRDESGYRLTTTIEIYYYLSHLATKKKSIKTPLVDFRLNYYLDLAGNTNIELHTLLAKTINGEEISVIAAEANHYLYTIGLLSPKQKGLMGLSAVIDTIQVRYRRYCNKRTAKKGIITFVGQDGVGKTTQIENLKNSLTTKSSYYRFKKLYRSSLLYSFLCLLRYPKNARKTLPKNEFDEQHTGLLFWIALFNYPRLWLRAKINGYQLVDRYYSDLLFKQLRQKNKDTELLHNWQSLAGFIPHPAWSIHLDASADVILGRKDELSRAAIDVYRKLTFEIYLANPALAYTYINTGTTLDLCQKSLATAMKNLSVFAKNIPSEIILNTDNILAQGNHRICYQHPLLADRIIKIDKVVTKDVRNQNKIESEYYKTLKNRKVPFTYIPECDGWQKSNFGQGLVFEKVVNDDGSSLCSLDACLRTGQISWPEAKILLESLGEYLIRNAIVFADLGLDNLVCQKRTTGWHLMIIDGLGARRLGLKFRLYSYVLPLARYKMRRQWQLLMIKFSDVIN